MQEYEPYYNKRYYNFYKRLGPIKGTLFNAWFPWIVLAVFAMVSLSLQGGGSKPLVAGILLWSFVLLGLSVRFWRRKRFRDALLLSVLVGLAGVLLLWGTGLLLIWREGDVSLFSWTSLLLMLIVGLGWKNRYREVKRWELARRKGYLKGYLDEKRRVIVYNPWEFYMVLTHAEGKEQEHVKRLEWARRLDKWSPLITGSAILFRRNVGHDMTMVGVALCVMGTFFLPDTLRRLMLYFKIREWERARGGGALVMIDKAK